MESKCFRKRCAWVLEVAHMDEALDQLQQHYRAVHPTKAFYRQNNAENLESFNLSADEVLERSNLAGDDADPNYDWRTLQNQVRHWRQDEQLYGTAYANSETIAEVERRVNEHFANQPPAAVEENANANQLGLRRIELAPAPVVAVDPFR